MLFLKNLVFTILVPGTVTVFIPYRLLSSRALRDVLEFGIARYLGAISIVFGALIYFWCLWNFAAVGRGTPAPIDPPKTLVVRGLYRYVRNPMYVGVMLILLGEGVWFESRVLFQYAGWVFLFFNLFVLLYEEAALRRQFGDSYQRYCQSVPRWIPRFTRPR